MAEPVEADLKSFPATYQSSRLVFDVLIGDDTALPLIEAGAAGDVVNLQSMLAQSSWAAIALESPHYIYSEDRPRQHDSETRRVYAAKGCNLERIIQKAAGNGHATAVSILLDFASQHGVKPSAIVHRPTIKNIIENGHAAVFKILAAADPAFITFGLLHLERFPLYLAVKKRRHDVVELLLQLRAGDACRKNPEQNRVTVGYPSSLLCLAAANSANPRILELLLQYHFPIAKSGALHRAAELEALENMRLLIENGADVDEVLPPDALPRYHHSLQATWTPMHFAAALGRADAMALLKSKGAQTERKDGNGMTPSELLEERKSARESGR